MSTAKKIAINGEENTYVYKGDRWITADVAQREDTTIAGSPQVPGVVGTAHSGPDPNPRGALRDFAQKARAYVRDGGAVLPRTQTYAGGYNYVDLDSEEHDSWEEPVVRVD